MFGFTSFASAPFADLGFSPNVSAYVASVLATASLGTATTVQVVEVTLAGVSATGSIGTLSFWVTINDSQTPSWQLIPRDQ